MITVCRAENSELAEIVKLHQAVLGHTINSRIGDWFLLKLYQAVLADPSSVLLKAVDGSQIVGLASATKDLADLNKKIKKQYNFQDYCRIALFFLLHPLAVRQFGQSILLHRYLATLAQPYPTILTIGVNPNCQGQGVGSKLMQNINSFFVGSKSFFADTEEPTLKLIIFIRKIISKK